MNDKPPTSLAVEQESSGEEAYFKEWFSRVLARTTVNLGGCWIWNGWTNVKGYGQTSWQSRNIAIHRKIYEILHGVLLTTEQFICHTCDTRRCWNPAHLFLGDAKTNNNDCAAKGRHHNSVKTHCKYGHPYDESNTGSKVLETGSVARVCKTCEAIRFKSESYIRWRREYQRRKRAEKKAKRSAQESHA